MSNAPIRAAIIGTGRISDLHAIEYGQSDRGGIVALCDRDTSLAQSRATSWGIDAPFITDDVDELLARPDVDLVEILLPHHLHLDVALKAMDAGKIVSLQKPMCMSVEEADRLVQAAESADKPVKIFENFLFHPPVLKARELVDQGAIGKPLSIRIKSNPGVGPEAWVVPASANAWRQQKDHAGGGPLVFDDGHHKFALAWHFMGNPTDVHAFIGETEAADGSILDAQSIVSFRFADNRIGNLEVVYSPELEIAGSYYAQDDRVEITGTRGVIWINCGHGHLGDAPAVTVYRDGTTTHFTDISRDWAMSFVLSTRDYLEALEAGRAPVLTPDEGRQVLKFALAAEESARSGRTITFEA